VKPITGGYQVTATAQTANVSLLNNAISIQAITTVGTAKIVNGVSSSDVNSQIAGAHIVGANVPVNVPKNFGVSIPGVATVILNASRSVTVGTTTAATGAGVVVTLLKAVGNNASGATVYITPVYVRLGDIDAQNTGHTSLGSAYATAVNGHGATLVNVRSDPTCLVNVQPGRTISCSLASVNLNPALALAGLKTTVEGQQTTALGEAHATAQTATVNLLSGLIKADAITADARVSAPTNSPIAVSGNSTFLNLVIGGTPYPANPGQNTKITLPGVTITLNQVSQNSNQVVVRAIDIVINTANYGLPVGAEIQVAAAAAKAT
jgi:hypothetical protein